MHLDMLSQCALRTGTASRPRVPPANFRGAMLAICELHLRQLPSSELLQLLLQQCDALVQMSKLKGGRNKVWRVRSQSQ